MGSFLSGILLPLLLFAGSLLNWSLLSIVDLLASLFILLTTPRKGLCSWKRVFILWNLIIFSSVIIVLHIIFYIIEAVEGSQQGLKYAWWAKLFGFVRCPSDHEPNVIYFVLVQLLVALVALVDLHSMEGSSYHSFGRIGSHIRALCFLLLPAVQLVVGISHPSWISLPFFICNCIGLVNWSLTRNFLGLFWWWKCLLYYAGFNIIFLYIYQLPFEFSSTIQRIADLAGLYRISTNSDWSEIWSGLSLVLFYFMLSFIRYDLIELTTTISEKENDLIEQLLPSTHSFCIYESRSSVRGTNIFLREAIFQLFSINFFTYGFPISLFALSFWSFQFASLCAFGLLAYVGYILYDCPPLFHLHRLNGLLLIFILLWAASTYVFNVAFVVLNNKLEKDMTIWETIGLWHYSQPGLFLFAQFCLGVLVALGNLVNNYIFLHLSSGNKQPEDSNPPIKEKEETEVLIVATIAWGLHKLSRAIVLLLILFIALRPGVIHAIYIVYFMIYLLSPTISRRIRQTLIFLCELHFALLYILQLNLVAKALEQKRGFALEILSQSGLLNQANSLDFLNIAAVACCCSIQNHGFDILFLFSSIVQQTPFHPLGWSVLKAGLNKSVLFSVYTSTFGESNSGDCSHGIVTWKSTHKQHLNAGKVLERRIVSYLNAIGKKFLSFYRSCGTYIVGLTILVTVYRVKPNYTSFSYLFLLLLWMNGRQLVGMTRRQLWFPLKVYSAAVFILIYSLSVSVSFKTWLSGMIDLYPAFGFDPDAPMLKNVWQSLAVLIVMELYSYERMQGKPLESVNTGERESSSIPFCRRLLIWHSEKILYISLLYASLSPISAFGFVYLLGLVICSTLPKFSRVPSKIFIVYSGFLLMMEYLFQIWGEQAEMFPGQKQSYLSDFLGLRLFKPGFFGLESGLRAKVLVIVACILQYNVFYWLGRMPNQHGRKEKWEEPCPLFDSIEARPTDIPMHTGYEPSTDINPFLRRHKGAMSNSWPSLDTGTSQLPIPDSSMPGISGRGYHRNYSDKHFWGSSQQNQKWNRKLIFLLRKERFDMQKTILRIYLKFLVENMFNLFGLEINMIALLLASFAVLNAISLLYVASLVACVLVSRHVIRKIWSVFVFVLASVLTLEYLAIWLNPISWKQHVPNSGKGSCRDCWRNSGKFFDYCKSCWLGTIVDDPRMLISYYVVFMLACFKLRADHLSSPSVWHTYQQILSQFKKASALSNLSFGTKSMWTFLDYLRLYSYCHLLDLVLALILITGTLEYDILHLGYLGFALVFFRLRLELLKKRNMIFKFLRIYNFSLIVLSLAYQSPFFGGFSEGKCGTTDYIYEVIGFYKYDYGFRITSRSALVEIVIYMLVALQTHMFSSQEFDYASNYLEAEQIDALVREQEKKAAWKTAQLQHICESEEQKHLQNMQVEKMKIEVLNLQDQLHGMSTNATFADTSPRNDGFRRRRSSSLKSYSQKSSPDKEEHYVKRHHRDMSFDSVFPFDLRESPKSLRSGSPSVESMGHLIDSLQEISEINGKTFIDTSFDEGGKRHRENPLISAVHLIGDGVSQVQFLGNKAVSNLVSFLNIDHEELDSIDQSSENETYHELESQGLGVEPLEDMLSMQSSSERTISHSTFFQIGIILRYIWAQMRSNNDVVCYCSFVLIFLWNFSLLSMVYLAALFLYALCVNTGPSHMFWVIILIYSEFCILLQYLYQIVIQHCGFSIHLSFLQQLGFPENRIMSSFVISNWPLFLVYLFTLIETSITAREGKWASVTEFSSFRERNDQQKQSRLPLSYKERIVKLFLPVKHVMKHMIIGLYRYWKSATEGAETPPYFVQISMEVTLWPEDGIQPERIESGVNKLLKAVNDMKCMEQNQTHPASRVRVQSIERSPENPNIALAVFEVEHVSPSTESVPAEWYRSLTPAADVANEIRKAQRAAILKETGFPYPIRTVIGGGKWELDLYAYVFCADLAVFFLVAIFYQSVIKSNSEFLEVYQLEDQFPKEFVYLLMVIFFLIVLDRVIYLCSFATGKVIFYLISLVLFTYSIMKYAWRMEPSHQHAGKLALRAIYLMKAISLALQAIQIRHGVPHKSTLYRQFLTSNVTQINFLGFRLYRALPFLYELRCVLDWSCTTTSLTMYDWLKLEDIHGSLFLVKCDVELNRIKHHQGQKQTRTTKFCNGICLFLVLLCVIWTPMLMYSSGNPTNIANPIRDANVRIDLATTNGRLTLFETTLCKKLSWDDLNAHVDLDPEGYLSTYNEKDIQLICCQADASTLWQVPPVVQAEFSKSLYWSMNMIFLWQFTRDRPKGKEIVKYELHLQDEELPNPMMVMEVLNGSTNSFRIYNVYPRYFRVTGSGDVRFLEQPVNLVSGDLVLNRGDQNWWSFHDIDTWDIGGCREFGGPMAIIVSEETPQGILGDTLSKFSIWGLYITFVLAVGRFIRLQCADLRMRIPFENLPSCDRLLAICENIYAARAEGALEVEEILYWTLVKIYRSPHMLLEYTKPD